MSHPSTTMHMPKQVRFAAALPTRRACGTGAGAGAGAAPTNARVAGVRLPRDVSPDCILTMTLDGAALHAHAADPTLWLLCPPAASAAGARTCLPKPRGAEVFVIATVLPTTPIAAIDALTRNAALLRAEDVRTALHGADDRRLVASSMAEAQAQAAQMLCMRRAECLRGVVATLPLPSDAPSEGPLALDLYLPFVRKHEAVVEVWCAFPECVNVRPTFDVCGDEAATSPPTPSPTAARTTFVERKASMSEEVLPQLFPHQQWVRCVGTMLAAPTLRVRLDADCSAYSPRPCLRPAAHRAYTSVAHVVVFVATFGHLPLHARLVLQQRTVPIAFPQRRSIVSDVVHLSCPQPAIKHWTCATRKAQTMGLRWVRTDAR